MGSQVFWARLYSKFIYYIIFTMMFFNRWKAKTVSLFGAISGKSKNYPGAD